MDRPFSQAESREMDSTDTSMETPKKQREVEVDHDTDEWTILGKRRANKSETDQNGKVSRSEWWKAGKEETCRSPKIDYPMEMTYQ